MYEKAGIISKTEKEAYSNTFLVRKHIGEGQRQMDDTTFAKQWRLILDLSSMNGNISDYATEPQTITSILEEYKPHKLQTSIDSLRAFHQVNLSQRSKDILGFSGAGLNWIHDKLPKGGVNSVNVLQSILNMVFKDMGGDGKSFMVYIDDIIITSQTPEEMEARLRQFF